MGKDNKIVAVNGGCPLITFDTDPALTDNSDESIASQKAVKSYVSSHVTDRLAAVQLTDGLIFDPAVMTASGVLPAVSFVQLNHQTVKIEATMIKPTPGHLLIITQTDAGTVGHTVTLGIGTWDGTNDVATFNAAGETLIVFGVSDTRFAIVENIGAVAFS